MLEIIASVCLLYEVDRCKEVTLPTATEQALTPMQCLMGAQIDLARWQDEHPRYFVKRWSCQKAGQFAKI